ncbi:uncharacterized protein BJ212DRAFT_1349344 [Suillus subaureus]|uniref:Uncharacterized protein n=1 Tax=Suillus subaureus TaxID=48587 RepID=A0A9P7JEN6_9AGAM|nr:uncharacterized protein BJ212DRAFT_1349344 [Suillus subaureus]KAG1818183.1 hypothetical protein BJ212DRAFT_1349344 [Suillus subaureus]
MSGILVHCSGFCSGLSDFAQRSPSQSPSHFHSCRLFRVVGSVTTSSADCSARRISHLHALCISAVIFCTCLIAEPGASLQYLFGELVLGLDFDHSNVRLGNVHILCSCYFVYGTINIMISYGML